MWLMQLRFAANVPELDDLVWEEKNVNYLINNFLNIDYMSNDHSLDLGC